MGQGIWAVAAGFAPRVLETGKVQTRRESVETSLRAVSVYGRVVEIVVISP